MHVHRTVVERSSTYGSATGTANHPVDQLVLAGRLDVHCVADVRSALHTAIDDGAGPLVVDLAGVEVADVTGLGVLVGAHRRAGRLGRTLVLRRVPPRLARLLTATRLHRILVVETYLPEAPDAECGEALPALT
ncbi:MAG: STAS domain-containing protein [Nocardioides sp.]